MKQSFFFSRILIFVSIVFGVLTFTFSCKKIDQSSKSVNLEIDVVHFFNLSDTVPTEIKKIALDLEKQNGFKQQLKEFVKANGFPVWAKSLLLTDNTTKTSLNKGAGSKSTETNIEDGLFFIPLKDEGTGEIKSYISCVKHKDSVYTYRLYNKAQVTNIEVQQNDTLKNFRNRVLSVFAYFEEKINNSNSTYFGGKTNSKIKNISIKALSNNSNNAGRFICGWRDVQIINVFTDAGGVTVVESYTVSYYTFCDISGSGSSGGGGTWSWDPSNVGTPSGTPGGGTSGSYGGIYYYTGGSGSTGGSTSGWWNYGSGYNGVYTIGSWYDPLLYPWGSGPYYNPINYLQSNAVQLLTISLGLTQEQETWLLNNSYQFSDALVNYLAFSIHPQDYKEQMARDHIYLLLNDPAYNSFVTNYHVSNGSSKVWWEDEQWLSTNYQGLYSNLENLSLTVKQGYYLLNNPSLNEDLNNYLLNSNGQTFEEKKQAATEHINGLLTNPAYVTFVQNYEATNNTGKMWWDRVGYDFAMPPFFWSYQGNNNQSLIDNYPNLSPAFQFPTNNNYATLYPRFTEMVMNLKTFVKENPKVMEALQKYSGLSKTQILDHLSFGQGPIISIVEMEGRIGQFKKENGNKTLEIRASYVRGLEQAVLESTKEGTAFLLAVTILHEYVHYGNFIGKRSEGAYDFGFGFERDAFNVIVEYFNANSVVIKFSKYF